MTATTKYSNDNMPIFIDDIISDMVRYLGNLTNFFHMLTEKNADALPDVFSRIVTDLEWQHQRLTNYQRHRKRQVKSKQELQIPANVNRMLNALSEHEWFQKTYWGQSKSLRTVSRDEAKGNAIEALMFGVAYIHHVPVGCPRGFQRWISGFYTSLGTYLAEFVENQ